MEVNSRVINDVDAVNNEKMAREERKEKIGKANKHGGKK